MSNTFKHKIRHIFYDKNGTINLKISPQLRYRYINMIRRHNLDYDLDRAELTERRGKVTKNEMNRQVANYYGYKNLKNGWLWN